jgi:hypothetical protein
MTTLDNRPNTALLIVDVQNSVVDDAHTTEDLTAWGAPPPEQVMSYTNMYWSGQTAPGRTAGTVETRGRQLQRLSRHATAGV